MDAITWQDVPDLVDALVEKTAAPAWDLRRATASLYPQGDVGFYFDPVVDKIGFYGRGTTEQDLETMHKVACDAIGSSLVADSPITDADLTDRFLVKVGYSPSIRTLGEKLNFFPGSTLGIPNAPSPLAALLTTAVIGGGLGYAGGRVIKAVMPENVGKKLPGTGALAGMTAGSLLAAPWVISNIEQGKSLLDGSTLADQEGEPRKPEAGAITGTQDEPESRIDWLNKKDPFRFRSVGMPAFKEGFDRVELTESFKGYLLKVASLFGSAAQKQPSTLTDVNINALGQTLWESGASPDLKATTLGTMYAASQMPDAQARPGWVSGRQLGTLAMNAAGDYATGLAVGAVLNATVGTPWRAPMFGTGAAAMGLLRATLPKLFG